jgi:hypothetical protein
LWMDRKKENQQWRERERERELRSIIVKKKKGSLPENYQIQT